MWLWLVKINHFGYVKVNELHGSRANDRSFFVICARALSSMCLDHLERKTFEW